MSQIVVTPVNDKKELKLFIKFPWKIYKDNPYWVPPLFMAIKARLDTEKTPFYNTLKENYFLPEKTGR